MLRCQFLLRPDAATNNAFLYYLIDATLRHPKRSRGELIDHE
jgi:hypothetical protein